MENKPPEITDRNQELVLLGEAVHRLTHQVSEALGILKEMKTEYDRMRPVIDGYQRGGILALRTARKAARNGT